MSVIDYKLATVTDIPVLIDLRIALLEEIAGQQPEEKNTELKHKLEVYFSKAMLTGDYICWLGRHGGEVVGIGAMALKELPASYKRPNGRSGYILNMYTIPAYRGNGVGAAIFERLIETGRNMQLCTIDLHATEEGKRLYEKYKFAPPKSTAMEIKL